MNYYFPFLFITDFVVGAVHADIDAVHDMDLGQHWLRQ